MDWRDYIHQDRNILQGKPVLKGTRLSVELILDCLAAGWSQEELLYNYPSLQAIHIPAVLAYAADLVRATRYEPLQGAAVTDPGSVKRALS